MATCHAQNPAPAEVPLLFNFSIRFELRVLLSWRNELFAERMSVSRHANKDVGDLQTLRF